MDISLFMLAFALFWKSTTSVRCYVCEPRNDFNTHIPVCDYFDGSDSYTTDCPLSTDCFKKIIALSSLEDSTTITSRGCAQQSQSVQKKNGSTWQYVTEIYQMEENCKEDSKELGKSTTTVHCFCQGDLCNGASGIDIGLSAMTVLIVSLLLIFR